MDTPPPNDHTPYTMSAEMLLNPPPSSNSKGGGGEAIVDEQQTIQNNNSNSNSHHPLLSRAQQTLKEQLLERKRELDEQLREKRFVLKKATKRREDAGVKMYGLQKTLSTLQTSLTSASEHLTSIASAHIKVCFLTWKHPNDPIYECFPTPQYFFWRDVGRRGAISMSETAYDKTGRVEHPTRENGEAER